MFPKWWFNVVIYSGTKKKKHLKQIQVDISLKSSHLTRSGQGTIGTSTLQEVTTKFACAALTTTWWIGEDWKQPKGKKKHRWKILMERKKTNVYIYICFRNAMHLFCFNTINFHCLFVASLLSA